MSAFDLHCLREEEEEEEEEEEDDDLTIGPAEQHYIYMNREVKCLVLLTRGIKEEDGLAQMLDIGVYPWTTVKPITSIKPNSKDLRGEIERRWNTIGKNGVKPRPNQWTNARLYEWLDEHPIKRKSDVAFLRREVRCLCLFRNSVLFS